MKLTSVTMMALLWVLFLSCTSSRINIYVSTDGNDQNDGSETHPVATIQKAKDLARQKAGYQTITIHIADDVYYLPNTLVFGSEDSGTPTNTITYKAINEGNAIISGGSLLELDWQPYKNGIYQAKTPEGLDIDQVFIDEKNQRMARYPNYDANKKTAAYQGFAADAFSAERAKNWADPTGGYIHAMHKSRWGGYHYSAVEKSMRFNSKPGTYFWSNGYSWRTCEVKNKEVILKVLSGELELDSLSLKDIGTKKLKGKQIVSSESITIKL